METKWLKTEIYTEEQVYKESAEVPVDVDFMLPDYCPDVVKILKCRAAARIASRDSSGGTVTVEGNVGITVLYCDEKNRVFAFEQPFPFAKSFETGILSDDIEIECRSRVEYMNCRAVTGRKIDIHGAVELCLTVTERKSAEILADYDDTCMELRRSAIPATTPMGRAQKYVTLEDEITVGQGQPEICSLLRYDAEPTVTESKLLNGKNIVKGELALRMLYAPEQGKPQQVRAVLPFSQLIEIIGATDECTCDATVKVACLEIRPKVTPMGETRSFSVNAKLSICSKAYCDREVEVITDAYSRKCETALSAAEVAFKRIDRVMDEVCRCQCTFEIADAPCEVLDLHCEVQNATAVFGEGDVTIGGTVMAGLLVCNQNGSPEYYEKPIEFSCKYPCGGICNATCDPVVTVKNCNYALTGEGQIEIRVELNVRAAILTTNACRLITDLSDFSDRPLAVEDRGAMTLYFGYAGESLWDIARRYRAGVEEIRSLNGVGETLETDQMIMIPMN